MSYKIFMFVPAFGQMVSTATFLATHSLRDTLNAKGIGGGLSSLSFPDIAELRDMALTIWYDVLKDNTHLLFIDADMAPPPDLILDMLLFDEPVVGALYAARQLPTTWVGSGDGQPQAQRRGEFMLVEGVGTGCMLIRRDAVDVMLQKMPHIVDPRIDLHPAANILRQAGANRLLRAFDKVDVPGRGILSEDLSFCLRWNHCGGQVWANIGHRIPHVGPFDFGARYLDMTQHQMVTVPRVQAGAEAEANLAPSNGTPIVEVPAGPVQETLQAAE